MRHHNSLSSLGQPPTRIRESICDTPWHNHTSIFIDGSDARQEHSAQPLHSDAADPAPLEEYEEDDAIWGGEGGETSTSCEEQSQEDVKEKLDYMANTAFRLVKEKNATAAQASDPTTLDWLRRPSPAKPPAWEIPRPGANAARVSDWVGSAVPDTIDMLNCSGPQAFAERVIEEAAALAGVESITKMARIALARASLLQVPPAFRARPNRL